MKYSTCRTEGDLAVQFSEANGKATIAGLFSKSQNKIYIHSITSNKKGEAKKLIQKLIKKFKTNKLIFTPLITTFIEQRFRGKITNIPATAEGNPYGEGIRCLEVEWK